MSAIQQQQQQYSSMDHQTVGYKTIGMLQDTGANNASELSKSVQASDQSSSYANASRVVRDAMGTAYANDL